MTTLKRLGRLALVALLIMGIGVGVVYGQSEAETEQALIQIVAASDTFAGWLEQYPDWIGHAYKGDDGANNWYVEFYDATETEWLGYATINADNGEIYEAFAPVPLDPQVYQEQQPRIQTLVLDDPEVLARLTDTAAWDVYMDYNRYESVWEVYLYRGIEAMVVKAKIDENDNFSIQDIADPNALSEEQAEQALRDEAINLAYGGEGIDRALEGYDNWLTYVEYQGGTRWSVAFEADGQPLFYALVDTQLDKVLEATVEGG